MTDLPGNVQTCGVKGHFAYARLQAGDADGVLDLVPVVGLVVTLTPSPTYLLDATASPPTVIVPDPLVLTTDSNGDLRDVDGNSTAYVIASDDPDLNPHDWTYTVSFAGTAADRFRAYSAAFPAGSTIDLSNITPVPSALGVSVSVAQAAEAAAAAYASAAAASAASITGTVAEAVTAPLTGAVTQGLYQRTIPTHAALGGTTFIPLAKDPSVSGRIWGARGGTSFGKIMWSDDNGTTATIATDMPLSGTAGAGSMKFGTSYVFLTQIGAGARGASLWRSPLPAANGTGLSWTKVFDLASPPGGITTGDNSTFKVGGLAVNGANVYLGEYTAGGGGNTGGGTQLYYSADSGATWTVAKTWANAKHVHDVRVINGVPWASLGDPQSGYTDIGLWSATTAAATTWVQRNLFGEGVGGNTYYPIGFIPVTIGGATMIALEADGSKNLGPLIFPTQSLSGTRSLVDTCRMPFTLLGSMRCLTMTSEGNLMWLHTGEGGSIGNLDAVCIAKGPDFSAPVILETVTSSGGPWLGGAFTREPIEDGQYIWIGTSRIRKEKFIGQ